MKKGADEVYGSRNPPLTNIGRLYHAANWKDQKETAESDGYFSYYFPGCGARFPEIGEEHYSLDGELFANGGEDRINRALLKNLQQHLLCGEKGKDRRQRTGYLSASDGHRLALLAADPEVQP